MEFQWNNGSKACIGRHEKSSVIHEVGEYIVKKTIRALPKGTKCFWFPTNFIYCRVHKLELNNIDRKKVGSNGFETPHV